MINETTAPLTLTQNHQADPPRVRSRVKGQGALHTSTSGPPPPPPPEVRKLTQIATYTASWRGDPGVQLGGV